MHSEHVTNLHPGWVLGGWLVALAVSSAAFLALVGLGFMGPTSESLPLFLPVTVAVGFFAGGLFVGLRWSDAPILHGVAIALVSVVVWFLGDVLLPEGVASFGAERSTATFALGMILVQLVAAVAGAWTGRRLVRRGETPTLD